MALLPILEFPDARLRKVATPVENVNAKIKQLVQDMRETMYDANGIGLAATQINVHKRVVVIDVSDEQDQLQVFINPEFTVIDADTFTYKEGCLSVPEFYDEIVRPQHIRVRAMNEHGEHFELEPEGLLAVCIQHEIDHLDGKLFVDYLSPVKRNRIRAKLEKLHKQNA